MQTEGIMLKKTFQNHYIKDSENDVETNAYTTCELNSDAYLILHLSKSFSFTPKDWICIC